MLPQCKKTIFRKTTIIDPARVHTESVIIKKKTSLHEKKQALQPGNFPKDLKAI